MQVAPEIVLLFSLFMGFMHALFICGALKVHVHSLTQMRP